MATPKFRRIASRAPDRSHAVPLASEPICGAMMKKGRTKPIECDRAAGWGTSHVGVGPCRLHGGNLSGHLVGCATAELSLLVEETVDMDPGEALLWCVSLAAQDLRWINSRIADLSSPTHRPVTTEKGRSDEKGSHHKTIREPRQLEGYIVERFKAQERLARYSKMALDANVSERMVTLAERMGDLLAPVIEGILTELKLSPKQREKAPEIVRRQLIAIEGGLSS